MHLMVGANVGETSAAAVTEKMGNGGIARREDDAEKTGGGWRGMGLVFRSRETWAGMGRLV